MNLTSLSWRHQLGAMESLTISEFCVRHHIGRTTYFKMRKDACSPKELRVGRVVRITAEAEREWLERMQAPMTEVL